MVDQGQTLASVGGMLCTRIVVHTTANAWKVRPHIALALQAEQFRHKYPDGSVATLKIAVEDPPEKDPVKLAMALAKSMLVSKYSLPAAEVRGDYKLPVATVCVCRSKQVRGIPLLMWSQKDGWSVAGSGFAAIGITTPSEQILADIKTYNF